MAHQKTHAGFTLVELMVTLALVSIVLTVGVPSFQQSVKRNRITTQTNAFIGALVLARSEAISRGESVVICKSTDSSSCSSAAPGYHSGWIIFSDGNGDGAIDVDDEIIRSSASAPGTTTIAANADAVSNKVTYLATGFVDLTAAATFYVCESDYNIRRKITLRPMGRASVQIENNSSC